MLKPYNRAELSFALQAEIGQQGKNSQVYIAHDPQLNAELVIKRINKQKFTNRNEFYQEAGTLYLSGHPNVVPIHYACEDNDNVYLAMPHYRQGSLRHILDARFLTVREIIRFASQFLSGVHNIHSKGLIHFDIKPDNILISDQNEAIISDFGLTKAVSAGGLAGQDRVYLKMMPPEAFGNDQFSYSFDIYQAGLTLYRMCVGDQEFYRQFEAYGTNPNFDRDQFKFDVRNSRFPSTADFPEHIPQALITTIKKCLETNPTNRYTSALEIINGIADIDENLLDWEYRVDTTAQIRIWQKTEPFGKVVRLQVNQGTNASLAQKSRGSSMQKINQYCLTSINRAQIKEFLRGF